MLAKQNPRKKNSNFPSHCQPSPRWFLTLIVLIATPFIPPRTSRNSKPKLQLPLLLSWRLTAKFTLMALSFTFRQATLFPAPKSCLKFTSSFVWLPKLNAVVITITLKTSRGLSKERIISAISRDFNCQKIRANERVRVCVCVGVLKGIVIYNRQT